MIFVAGMNWDIGSAAQPHGLWWRKPRKLFHEYFQRDVGIKYQPIQRQETKNSLHRLVSQEANATKNDDCSLNLYMQA